MEGVVLRKKTGNEKSCDTVPLKGQEYDVKTGLKVVLFYRP
jgi:hypothetical protein